MKRPVTINSTYNAPYDSCNYDDGTQYNKEHKLYYSTNF